MLLTLQFPISDLRSFLPDRGGRRQLPDWPPEADLPPIQFVRFFGAAVRRARGADDAWTDEKSYCRADRAVRFAGLGARKFLKHRLLAPRCAFRRVLSDGHVVARVEVGISIPHPDPGRSFAVSAEELMLIADAALSLPSFARTWSGQLMPNPLVLQGRRLAKLFAYATTFRNKFDFAKTPRLLEAGMPLLLVELGENQLDELPPGFVRVKSSDAQGSELAFGRLRVRGVPVPIWIIRPGQAETPQLRSLRLCLLRLHAEREALKAVLNGLDRGWIDFLPGTPEGNSLEEYLNEATRIIYRQAWSNINQSAILQALDSAIEVDFPADRDNLLRRYDGARRQVWKKVERYEYELKAARTVTTLNVAEGAIKMETYNQNINNSNITGAVINKLDAERIEGSFQAFANTNPNDDLKKSVAVLHEEVKSLLAKLPADSPQKETVLSNLETFTNQASQKKPLNEVLKVTGKGLVDAAKTVAEMVGPITTAVVGVLKLFGLFLA